MGEDPKANPNTPHPGIVAQAGVLAAARRIYEEWNEGFDTQDLERIIAVYADHAVIETPAVLSIYPAAEEGILRGKAEIRKLFAANLAAFKGAFHGLYRSGRFYSDGEYLTWEYPRATPTGAQVDLFESMDLEGGLVVYHRVYWGWRGMQNLIANREKARG